MVKSLSEGQRLRTAQTALRWKLTLGSEQRIQMVLLREGGMTQPAIAAAVGVSLSTVNRAQTADDDVRHQGRLENEQRTGRKRENMTVAQEKALLTRFANMYAGAGELLNIHDAQDSL